MPRSRKRTAKQNRSPYGGRHPYNAALQAPREANEVIGDAGKVLASPAVVQAVEAPRSPARVFVTSMADLFHRDVPDEFIEAVFAEMALRPWHTFLVLTKRPERMAEWFNSPLVLGTRVEEVARSAEHRGGIVWDARGSDQWAYPRATAADVSNRRPWPGWPLPNVWIGTTVEDQARADERIPHLLRVPARVRFLSMEPLLGPVDLASRYLADVSRLTVSGRPSRDPYDRGLQWIITGGESGPHARPSHPDWFRSLRDQCQAAEVPFFFKQWGCWAPFYDRDIDDPDWRAIPKEGPSVKRINLAGGQGFHGDRVVYLRRIGKSAAGRLLDGVEWSQVPEVGRG